MPAAMHDVLVWRAAASRFMLLFVRHYHPSTGRNVPDASANPSDTATETCPTSEPALRAIAMPADTNPHGDIFGGWLLCQMDLAGSTFATRRANGRVVTVAITGMAFHRPVMVGDEVTCFCDVEKTGHTSITVKIQSWVRRRIDPTPIKVTEGLFTYVHVGDDGRPIPIGA
ncbi:MAG TPA: acyl-CoA thioesterase [Xanthobacteraceae bacterium]|nr:acyl-CoA thioesterase [Xanthobacteraceae bacterium]